MDEGPLTPSKPHDDLERNSLKRKADYGTAKSNKKPRYNIDREELDALVMLKVEEYLKNTSDVGELKNKLKFALIKQMRQAKLLNVLKKQLEDARIVIRNLIEEENTEKTGTNYAVPLKVTRSVGLQVCTVGTVNMCNSKSKDKASVQQLLHLDENGETEKKDSGIVKKLTPAKNVASSSNQEATRSIPQTTRNSSSAKQQMASAVNIAQTKTNPFPKNQLINSIAPGTSLRWICCKGKNQFFAKPSPETAAIIRRLSGELFKIPLTPAERKSVASSSNQEATSTISQTTRNSSSATGQIISTVYTARTKTNSSPKNVVNSSPAGASSEHVFAKLSLATGTNKKILSGPLCQNLTPAERKNVASSSNQEATSTISQTTRNSSSATGQIISTVYTARTKTNSSPKNVVNSSPAGASSEHVFAKLSLATGTNKKILSGPLCQNLTPAERKSVASSSNQEATSTISQTTRNSSSATGQIISTVYTARTKTNSSPKNVVNSSPAGASSEHVFAKLSLATGTNKKILSGPLCQNLTPAERKSVASSSNQEATSTISQTTRNSSSATGQIISTVYTARTKTNSSPKNVVNSSPAGASSEHVFAKLSLATGTNKKILSGPLCQNLTPAERKSVASSSNQEATSTISQTTRNSSSATGQIISTVYTARTKTNSSPKNVVNSSPAGASSEHVFAKLSLATGTNKKILSGPLCQNLTPAERKSVASSSNQEATSTISQTTRNSSSATGQIISTVYTARTKTNSSPKNVVNSSPAGASSEHVFAKLSLATGTNKKILSGPLCQNLTPAERKSVASSSNQEATSTISQTTRTRNSSSATGQIISTVYTARTKTNSSPKNVVNSSPAGASSEHVIAKPSLATGTNKKRLSGPLCQNNQKNVTIEAAIDLTDSDDDAAKPSTSQSAKLAFPVKGSTIVCKLDFAGDHSVRTENLPKLPFCLHDVEIPPRPLLSIGKFISGKPGIMLSWTFEPGKIPANIEKYEVYKFQENKDGVRGKDDTWKKVGDINALRLPMACFLTPQCVEGHKYHYVVRAVTKENIVGEFSRPVNCMFQSLPTAVTTRPAK